MLSYSPTPVVEIEHALLRRAEVRLLIKREDLNHPLVSGNKWWKLKYNLKKVIDDNHRTILTFGGAYSNHIYATAAAASAVNLNSIGIIRGEQTLPLNPTLQFASDRGMKLCYVSREEYRTRNNSLFIDQLQQAHGDFYMIPEGGTNDLAVSGCEEFGMLVNKISADYICLPVGTGGTMAGFLRSVAGKKVIGFSVLKNGGFLRQQILLYSGHYNANWELRTDYAYGGYAKKNQQVSDFIKKFTEQINIPLDFVYTGKMMCAVFDLIERGFFQRGKTVLAVHTGGLQGHTQ